VPGIPVLVWKDAAASTRCARGLAISNIADKDEAGGLVGFSSTDNAVWENRSSLEPSYASWEKPKSARPLKLLPETNCSECGVAHLHGVRRNSPTARCASRTAPAWATKTGAEHCRPSGTWPLAVRVAAPRANP